MNQPHSADHVIATNAIEDPLADPDWFKRAVFYEVMVRSFRDSNGDGIGDFAGLAEKLDYLQWLGVDCLWLPPFFPSPLADGGYDISDYTDVLSELGTVEEFRAFVDGAHERGLRIIIDFVMNHTSDQHPWFVESRNNPDGPYGDFYVWSDTDVAYSDARIIFVDTEISNWTFDPVRGQYFWHRFYSHQPDLNFENPAVLEEMKQAIRFWMDMGIDGFRLDAVPYLIEEDGSNCENLGGTHEVLKAVRRMVDEEFPGRILLCEANQWPEEVVEYFGPDGDECHMAFHFPVMPRLYMGLRQQNRECISEILAQTPEIPENCQWGTFLRNHDELTLEMVSDAEREYMWDEYAPDPRMKCNIGIRRRLAPLVDGDLSRVQLLHALLLAMPGSPVLYYGDEIGMGDNIWLNDRDGVRTPMQWSAETGAGFSDADEDDFFLPLVQDPRYHRDSVNVDAQMADPGSMLAWLRAMLRMRRSHDVFGTGTFTDLGGENMAVFSFLRRSAQGEEAILCINNLSDESQDVTLNLPAYEGVEPDDLLLDNPQERIADGRFSAHIAPYGFAWFDLSGEPLSKEEPMAEPEITDPVAHRDALMWEHLSGARWYGGKGRAGELAGLTELPWISELGTGLAVRSEIAEIAFAGDAGPSDTQHYQLLLAYRPLDAELSPAVEAAELGRMILPDLGEVRAFDAAKDPEAMSVWLGSFIGAERGDGWRTGFSQHPIEPQQGEGESAVEPLTSDLRPYIFGGEQSNTSVMFGDAAMVKLFRRLEIGRNLDIEVHEAFSHDTAVDAAKLYGWTEAFWPIDDRITRADLAMVVEQFSNAHDGWDVALESCRTDRPFTEASRLGLALRSVHEALERHFAVDIAPGAVTADTMNHRLDEAMLSAPQLRPFEHGLRTMFSHLSPLDLPVQRVHGDFHLGQVLFTEDGPKIIDFEGEPSKTMTERLLPDTPWRDVAGLIRSFDYAAGTVAAEEPTHQPGIEQLETAEERRVRATRWAQACRRDFLAAYAGDLTAEHEAILTAYVADKAVYEVVYEVRNRPTWVDIPLTAIDNLTASPLSAPEQSIETVSATDEGTL